MIRSLMLFRLARRSVWRNKRRSLLTLSAIAAGILSAVMLGALARGLSDTAIRAAIRNLTGHVQLHAPGYLDDPSIEYRLPEVSGSLQRVLDSEAVSSWTQRVRVPAVLRSEREATGVTLLGVSPAKELDLSMLGDAAILGRMVRDENDDGLLLGVKLAELLQTEIGKRVVVLSQGADGGVAERGFRVVGLFDAELESAERQFIFTGRVPAQELLGIKGEVSEVVLLGQDRDALEELQRTLQRAAPRAQIDDWKTLEPFAVALVKVQSGFLFIWYGIVIVTISFGLVNTLFMAVFERTRELALLQALGMVPHQIVLQILIESAVLLVGGVLLGNILTYVCLVWLSEGIDLGSFAEGTQMLGVGRVIYPKLQWVDWSIANSLIVGLSLFASVFPAWHAGRLRPAEAFATA
ncbi:MAG: ABC transporter permease [Bdellovibrionales bacterium]|nr:ABC transporter permease [Bdellovibrionales bacterium]